MYLLPFGSGHPFGTVLDKEDFDRLQDDQKIPQQGVIVDIEQVVTQLIVEGRIVFAFHLGQSGQPRLNLQALCVLGNPGGKLFTEERPLRPGAYNAHIALQDIEYLGQFVHP